MQNIEEIAIVEEIEVSDMDSSNDEVHSESVLRAMYDQISDQMSRMKGVCDKNYEQLESMKFMCMEQLSESQIALIEKNGNCLFTAIAHQIFGAQLKSDELDYQSKEPRADVVAFIKANMSLFKWYMLGSIYAKNPTEEIKDQNKACERYLLKLSKDRYWAGMEAVRAISMIRNVNILVINEKGDSAYPCGFQNNCNQTIIIAYKFAVGSEEKRDHYDSVIYVDPEIMFYLTKEIKKAKLYSKEYND